MQISLPPPFLHLFPSQLGFPRLQALIMRAEGKKGKGERSPLILSQKSTKAGKKDKPSFRTRYPPHKTRSLKKTSACKKSLDSARIVDLLYRLLYMLLLLRSGHRCLSRVIRWGILCLNISVFQELPLAFPLSEGEMGKLPPLDNSLLEHTSLASENSPYEKK